MPTLFLDNNIWNYLVSPLPNYSEIQLKQAREHLLEGIRDDEWQVVSSLPILQEVAGTYRKDPPKYETIKNFMFEAVGNRWLLDRPERYVAELSNGGVLSETTRFLNRKKRHQIERLVNKKKDIIEVSDIAHSEALSFKEKQDEVKKQVFIDLGSADGKSLKNSGKAYEKWFANNRDLEGWVLKVLEGSASKGLFAAPKLHGFKPSYSSCPTIWQYVDFQQAKVLRNLGHGIKIESGDAVDMDTYGCSPYFDKLFTQDGEFKKTIDLVVNDRFEVCDFGQLMQMLGVS